MSVPSLSLVQSLYQLAPYEVKELLKDLLKDEDPTRFNCKFTSSLQQ